MYLKETNFYFKGERLLHTIHSLKFLESKPTAFGPLQRRLTSEGAIFPRSTSVGRSVDRANAVPTEGQSIVGINKINLFFHY